METIQPNDFERIVLQADKPVIVEFGAEWCVPCKRLEPILEQLAARWQGRARFARLDVDENPTLVTRYQVMSVPTVILFAGGSPRAALPGLQSLEKLARALEGYLS